MNETASPVMNETASADVPLDIWQKFVYLVATPWWRAVWFVGAIVWFFVFVALVGSSRDYALLLAALGATPLVTFFVDISRRVRAIRRRGKQ